jgi:hypothetical protein
LIVAIIVSKRPENAIARRLARALLKSCRRRSGSAAMTDHTRRSLDFILSQQAQFGIDLQQAREDLARLEGVTREQYGTRMDATAVLARTVVAALQRVDQRLKDLDMRTTRLAARLAALEARMEQGGAP